MVLLPSSATITVTDSWTDRTTSHDVTTEFYRYFFGTMSIGFVLETFWTYQDYNKSIKKAIAEAI